MYEYPWEPNGSVLSTVGFALERDSAIDSARMQKVRALAGPPSSTEPIHVGATNLLFLD